MSDNGFILKPEYILFGIVLLAATGGFLLGRLTWDEYWKIALTLLGLLGGIPYGSYRTFRVFSKVQNK